MYKILIIIIILTLIISIPVYPIQEKDYVAITGIEGGVEKRVENIFLKILRIKIWQEINKNESLQIGDRIRTRKNGKLELYFSNETYVKVAPETEIIIGKGEVTETGNTASLKLNQGRIWSKVNSVWQGLTKFKVITPSAIAGVKGTIFSVMVKGNKVSLSVKEGQVAFETIDGSTSLDVNKGYMSLVKSGKMSSPVKINEKENKQWEKVKKFIIKDKTGQNQKKSGDNERGKPQNPHSNKDNDNNMNDDNEFEDRQTNKKNGEDDNPQEDWETGDSNNDNQPKDNESNDNNIQDNDDIDDNNINNDEKDEDIQRENL